MVWSKIIFPSLNKAKATTKETAPPSGWETELGAIQVLRHEGMAVTFRGLIGGDQLCKIRETN